MVGPVVPTVGAWLVDDRRSGRLRLTPEGHGPIVGPAAASDIRICRRVGAQCLPKLGFPTGCPRLGLRSAADVVDLERRWLACVPPRRLPSLSR
jgi:hypothetical protein